jgi:L-2-hydroxyglutarate oxidase LhgO
MIENVDVLVIGAGVIGLACARSLAMAGKDVIILEQCNDFGTQTSSRNSEVIHAGIYYPSNSLKAKLCVRGRDLLYDYCDTRSVNFSKCGKLIVANSESQINNLNDINSRAKLNGVYDLQFLSEDQTRSLEPELKCFGALFSPSTGIVDSHGLMLSLLGEAQKHGAVLAVKSTVLSIESTLKGIKVVIDTEHEERSELLAKIVINATGHNATSLALTCKAISKAKIPRSYFAKGSYFSLSAKSPFQRLIYPIPEEGGLGVHLTIDLGGQAKFGPDVEWINHIDYEIDINRVHNFYAEIRKYWPNLPNDSLQPAYVGIRPKISPAGLDSDFVIQSEQEHGVNGLINLFGIESPGLTASLAIAEYVSDKLDEF